MHVWEKPLRCDAGLAMHQRWTGKRKQAPTHTNDGQQLPARTATYSHVPAYTTRAMTRAEFRDSMQVLAAVHHEQR